MVEIIIEVDGPEEAIAHIERFAAGYPAAMGRAMWLESTVIMNMAKRQTPVDFGILRGSGVVQDPASSDGLTSVEMGLYTYYAWYVHEGRPKVKRGPRAGSVPYHDDGKFHFLKDPFELREPYIIENLVRRLNRFLGV